MKITLYARPNGIANFIGGEGTYFIGCLVKMEEFVCPVEITVGEFNIEYTAQPVGMYSLPTVKVSKYTEQSTGPK
jgi:hypothetical protein